MTKDLADKSNELIDAMTNTIKKLSPSKDEAIKFLMDIRNHIDVLLKSNKFEFGGAVQSYNVPWMGGQPTPSYAKGGKFEDSGWIKSLPNAMGYEAEDVFEPMAKSSKDKFEFREKVRDWDSDGVLNEGKSGDEWIDRQYKSYSKGGKFADGGMVNSNGEHYSYFEYVAKYDYLQDTIYDVKIGINEDEEFGGELVADYDGITIDDIREMFGNQIAQRVANGYGRDYEEGDYRSKVIFVNNGLYKKGGKLPRKKGLGWKRDRERISQEPHEQAYKSKRKGKYSSFEMGGDIENISDLYDSMEAGNYPYARDMGAYFIFGDKERGNIIFDAVNGRYTSERADESELSDIMIQYDNTWKDNMEQLDVETMESLGDLTEYYSNYAKGGRTTRAINQDRARLSKQKHEQAYKSKRKGDYSSFEMGGKTMIDEEFSNVPEELEEVFGMYNEDEETYTEMKRLKGIANQKGYDFDYGLDGEPTEFWKINKMAKGGKTDFIQDVVDSPNFREGAFRRKAEARGMSTDAFMNQVLHSPHLYDERTRKQAQFMKNAFND